MFNSSSSTSPPAAEPASAPANISQLQIINGPWKKERQFGRDRLSSAVGMAVNLNGDVAIVDDVTARVEVFSSDGKYRFNLDTTQGLEPGSYPHQIIVNSDSNYLVTYMTKYVHVYDVNGQFKEQWVSCNPQSSSVSPSLFGIAIDSRGHILTGDTENMCINTHKKDGTYITSIKVDTWPAFLGVTSQDTIIVAEWYKPPQIVSNTGQVLCTLKHPVGDEEKLRLHGVCCYEDIIFICDVRTHSILCYSVSGEYLDSINLDITFPCGISLTENGNKLMVGCLKDVKVFTRTA